MRRTLALCLVLLLFVGAALAEVFLTDGTYDPGETLFVMPGTETPAPTEENPEAPAAVEILLSATGDVTIGGNMRGNPASNMYTKALTAQDGDLTAFFQNVRELFQADDLTLVNFEGTLTTAMDYKKENEYCFKAPPEHIEVITSGGVDAVAFENNHVRDFYQQGFEDTIKAFDAAGIVYATDGVLGIYEVKGVTIGLLAYQTINDLYDYIYGRMPEDIMDARRKGCQLVIVSYHWGAELDYIPHTRQQDLGRATIDAGADLVLGHHSHRINPIEYYEGRYIVYSLGNFCFSGNTMPSDMDSFIYQQKFIVSQSAAMPGPFRIIPISISSVTAAKDAKSDTNDLIPTPFAPGGKGEKRVIDTLLENGLALPYGVTEYPVTWE